MSTATTALGREVPVEMWKDLHGDTILKHMLVVANSPFAPAGYCPAEDDLRSLTGLDEDMLAQVLEHLRALGLVQPSELRLTPLGRFLVGIAVAQRGDGWS